jgi:hypothetical protein
MATAAHLLELTQAPSPARAEIAASLDGLTPADRLEAVRSLRGAGPQRRLWEAVAAAPPGEIDEIVPPDAPPLREFIYHGKNSLPAFTLFASSNRAIELPSMALVKRRQQLCALRLSVEEQFRDKA